MEQSIFSNALIATLGRGLTLACGIIATALMARILGAAGLGTYSLILTIGTILQLTADFGLYLTLSRELGVSEGKPNDKIAHIVSLRLTLLIVAFALGCVGLLVFPSLRMAIGLFVVFAVGLMFQSASQLLMSVFQAYGCVWRATIGDVAGRVAQVSALTTALFVPTLATPIGVASAFTGGLILSFVIHLILVPEKQLLYVRASRKVWWHIMQLSWPIALMLILNVIYFRIDTVLLSYLRTSEEVGLYSLAYKVIENGLFFPAMIGGLLLPAITSAVNKGRKERVQRLVREGLTLSLSGATILVAILVGFSDEIILLLGGPEFISSSVLLRILSLALGTMCIGNIFGFALIALGKQKSLAALYGALATFNILANLMLIPRFGAIGAAWVTVATEVGATVVAGIFVKRHISWTISASTVLLMVVGAIVSVWVPAMLLAHESIWLRLVVTGCTYVALMQYCGVWSRTSLSTLRTKEGI